MIIKRLKLDSFKHIDFERKNDNSILMNIVDNSGSRCILSLYDDDVLVLCDILLELIEKGQNDSNG